MKKNSILFTFLLATVFMVFSCNTLSLSLDSVDEHGTRTLCTSNIGLFGEFDMALGAKVEKNDTILGVLITCGMKSDHGVFNKADYLRLRLNDGQEISLQNLYEKEFEKSNNTEVYETPEMEERFVYTYSRRSRGIVITPVMVHRMVQHVHTSITTNSYALYLISKHQLEDIMQKGVAKLRVEIEDADYDMPNPEKAQEKFIKLYNYLHQQATHPFIRSKF